MTGNPGYEIFVTIATIAVFGGVILALMGIDPSGYLDFLPAIIILAFVIGISLTVGSAIAGKAN
jgi:hypothetical protein